MAGFLRGVLDPPCYMYFEIYKSDKITVGEVVSAEHQDI